MGVRESQHDDGDDDERERHDDDVGHLVLEVKEH